MPTSRVVDKNTLMGWLKQLGIALLYLLSGYVINHSFTLNGIVSTVWPGSGLALAALLLGGRYYLWGAFLGALIVNALSIDSLIGIIGATLAGMLEVLLAVWMLTRNGRIPSLLYTLPDYLRLIILGGGIASIAGAIIGTSTLLLSGFLISKMLQLAHSY